MDRQSFAAVPVQARGADQDTQVDTRPAWKRLAEPATVYRLGKI
jgi:hypothetical protein